MKCTQFLLSVIMICLTTNALGQNELIQKGKRPTMKNIVQDGESDEENLLAGFWTEYKRTYNIKRNKEVEIDFADTMKFNFTADSTAYQYYAMGKTIQTDYGFERKKFYYSADKTLYDFKMKDDKFSISRKDTTYYFTKVDKLYFPLIQKVVPNATSGKIEKLDEPFLLGRWLVYKKTDPAFDRKNVYLYKLEIGEPQGYDTYEIKAHYDNANTIVSDSGSMIIDDHTLVLKIMDQTKEYKINMAVDNEMILQDGEVIYYLKK